MFLREAGGCRIAHREAHEGLPNVGCGFLQFVILDEEAWSRFASVETEFVGIWIADEFR